MRGLRVAPAPGGRVGMVRPLRRPVPDEGLEVVRHGRDPLLLVQLRERQSDSALPRRLGKTNPARSPSACSPPGIYMARPFSGTRCSRFAFVRMPGTVPTIRPDVDFDPRLQPYFPGPGRRQHQELEGPFGSGPRPRCSDGRNGASYIVVRKRRHMPNDGLLTAVRLPERVAGWVIGSVLHRHCPLHDAADALLHPPRRLGLVVPDRSQDLQRVARGNLGDRLLYQCTGGLSRFQCRITVSQ